MRIKKIRLSNGYKRFHDLTIDLGDQPKKIIALVGPNGCGKSSVLDGMLFHANNWGMIGNKGAKGIEYHSMNAVPNYGYDNVQIDFTDGSFQEVYAAKRALGKDRTIFSFRSPYRYNSSLKVVETRAVSEIKNNSYGATSASDLDDKMEDNYRRLNVLYNRYLESADCKPSEAKLKIIGDLNRAITNCLDLEISNLGNVEASKGTLYFKKKDHPVEFDFNVLSSGEKEVVDLLLDLYLRRDEYSETVFLLDEPELHINTSIQKNLLIEINKLIGENCQLWVTTHSIGFLRALQETLKDDCQIILFKDDLNLASTKQVLEPIKRNLMNWREMFSVALDDLAKLVSPERIIYCEGKDRAGKDGEENGFDAKVFNTIFSEKHHQTLFVSSGGNTELDQRSDIAINILSKVFSKVQILVLKDRDMASGKITNDADRNEYLKLNPPHHRVLKRWEIENYLFDKEVLKKFSSSNGLVFGEHEYDSLITDIVNQDVKSLTQEIKKICGLDLNSNTEKFKLQLSTFIIDDMDVYKELESCIF
jgi:predicted ATPase